MKDKKAISDSNIQPSGENEDSQEEESQVKVSDQTDQSRSEIKDDFVSYDTHRKLLGEKKKEREENLRLRKQLNDLLEEKSMREEAQLKENNDWKALAEKRYEELKSHEAKLKQIEQDRIDAKKLDSFLSALPCNLERKFWRLIDIDKILVNPDSGEVDEMTVTKQVEVWKKEYPETLGYSGSGAKLPNESPKPTDSLSYDKWKNMSAAEMRKHLKTVVANEKGV